MDEIVSYLDSILDILMNICKHKRDTPDFKELHDLLSNLNNNSLGNIDIFKSSLIFEHIENINYLKAYKDNFIIKEFYVYLPSAIPVDSYISGLDYLTDIFKKEISESDLKKSGLLEVISGVKDFFNSSDDEVEYSELWVISLLKASTLVQDINALNIINLITS